MTYLWHIRLFTVVRCSILFKVCTCILGAKNDDKDHPDYVPSVFNFSHKGSGSTTKRKVNRYKRLAERQQLTGMFAEYVDIKEKTC